MRSGFPEVHETAPRHARYVGLFYYSAYWRTWDEVLSVKNNRWVVREIGTTKVREHYTALWASRFAERPFTVRN